MHNQKIIQAGIIGGIVSAGLYAIPILNFINCFCCAGIMIGGTIALLYFDRSEPEKLFIVPAAAMTLGLSAGIFAAFFSLLLEWIIFVNFEDWQFKLIQSLTDEMEEIPVFIEEMIKEIENIHLQGFPFASTLFRNLIIMPVLCVCGALIARFFLNRTRK